jgi:hypothetical protein
MGSKGSTYDSQLLRQPSQKQSDGLYVLIYEIRAEALISTMQGSIRTLLTGRNVMMRSKIIKLNSSEDKEMGVSRAAARRAVCRVTSYSHITMWQIGSSHSDPDRPVWEMTLHPS